jgi:hypothetical protein
MNLNGLPIRGTNNYKGFVTIGTDVTEGLTTTLKAVGDGNGGYSPLQLSTTQVAVVNAISGAYKGLSIINTSYTDNGFAALLFENTNVSYNAVSARIASNVGSGGVNPTLEFWTANAAKTITLAGVIDKNQNWVIGTTSASARLHVRGDGTNPIARFESSAGANFFTINNSGQTIWGSAGANEPYIVNYNGTSTESSTGQSLRIRQRANTGSTGNTLIQYWADGLFSGTTSGTAISHEFVSSGFLGSGAGNANYRHSTHAYTINNSAAQTGTATGIFLNATETALNGMTHNLMDLQAGGVSKFKVASNGVVSNVAAYQVSSSGYYGVGGGSYIAFPSDGNATLSAWSGGWSLLRFGGTTNAFPAIKRNSAAIDFRLADDSGYTSINVGGAALNGVNGYIAINNSLTIDSSLRALRTDPGSSPFFISTDEVGVGSNTTFASAIFAVTSTTRGFLPPRMDDAAVRAITTPEEGLVVFNTTISHFCVYQGGNWVRMSHSPM